MASTSKKRLFFSCLYLGVLFLGAGVAFQYLQRFSGTIFLLPGASERLVFAPSDGAFRLAAAQRTVPPDLLLFDNPRGVKALRTDLAYDGLILPFSLRLDEARVLKEHAPRDVLHIEGPDGAREEQVAPGTQVVLSDTRLAVTSIGPWEGLIRDPRGQPMATLAWANDNEAANLAFLEAGHVYLLRPDLAVCFLWHENEAAATAAQIDRLDEVEGARWGVREGGAIQWFENFIPGTGAVLRDGTRVTLAEASRAEGWLTLRVQQGTEVHTERVSANASQADSPWLFEDPAGTGRVLYLHAWNEDSTLARLLTRGAAVQSMKLAPETDWPLPGGPRVAIRQSMGQAIAAPGGHVRAAYVQLGEKTLALREGLAETIGEYRVRYQAEPVPPDARYRVTALDEQGAVLEERTLETDRSVRIGAWIFGLSRENPFAPRGVALTAERRPGGAGHYIGLTLFVFGSFGLVIARFAPKP